ncbi:MAG: glycosyltransferase family 2 protein [archaeon]
MALDVLMTIGGFILAFLFSFIFAIFVIIMVSYFKKVPKPDFSPKISIVIPCYNEEKNIARCLDSIFSSSYPADKFGVVVVDDGSTDSTLKVLRDYQKRHKFKVVSESHKGKSECLNRGVMEAKHDFILTLDADTVLTRDCIHKIVQPFYDDAVGATNGSCLALNNKSFWGIFQGIEYHYNNLIRKSFSDLFNNAIWFFGAFACYRRDVLEKIGYFKKDTLAEDMDTALSLYSKGYRIVNVHDAIVYTKVPSTFLGLFKQRIRWWAGVLMSLNKNKHLFSKKSDPSILFLFFNQYWWSFYAVISFPLIAYQFSYWLPFNMATFFDLFSYTFRWFSLLGPVVVLYMIPEWGISSYSIFGVLSGLLSAFLIVNALYMFNDRLTFRNAFAIFFYFPYTIVLNSIIVISLIRLILPKKRYFMY